MLHGRCKELVAFDPRKREFLWHAQGIGDFANFVAGAVFCARCKNGGRRVSFAGLRFTWQAQGILTIDAMFDLRSNAKIPERGCIFGF